MEVKKCPEPLCLKTLPQNPGWNFGLVPLVFVHYIDQWQTLRKPANVLLDHAGHAAAGGIAVRPLPTDRARACRCHCSESALAWITQRAKRGTT